MKYRVSAIESHFLLVLTAVELFILAVCTNTAGGFSATTQSFAVLRAAPLSEYCDANLITCYLVAVRIWLVAELQKGHIPRWGSDTLPVGKRRGRTDMTEI